MTGRWFGMALALLVLAGCAGPAGSRRMSCPQSCDRGYEVCSDSAGAGRGGQSFFGVGAACERELKACLKNCDLAAVQAGPVARDGGKAAPGGAPETPETP